MPCDRSSESAAKRQKREGKQLATEMPADEPANIIELYAGPTVTVFVQGKEFKLPKRLLCHCWPFFDQSFNGNFQEAQTQMVTLDSATIDSFELAIK